MPIPSYSSMIDANSGFQGNHYPCALQTRSDLCIPRNETARPRSQFPHSCICERFINSLDWQFEFLNWIRILSGSVVESLNGYNKVSFRFDPACDNACKTNFEGKKRQLQQNVNAKHFFFPIGCAVFKCLWILNSPLFLVVGPYFILLVLLNLVSLHWIWGLGKFYIRNTWGRLI